MHAIPAASAGPAPASPSPSRTAASVRVATSWLLLAIAVACWTAVAIARLPTAVDSVWSWMLAYAAVLAVVTTIVACLPRHPLSIWFAVTSTVSVSEAAVAVLSAQVEAGAEPFAVAGWTFAVQTTYLLPGIAISRVLACYPDGVPGDRLERRVLRLPWLLLLVPVSLLLGSATVVIPFYVHAPVPVPNPFALAPLVDPVVGGAVQESAGPAAVLVGALLLTRRYRRHAGAERRRIRRLLMPLVLLPVPLIAQGLPDAPGRDELVSFAWVCVMVAFCVALAFGMLAPESTSADRAVRGIALYGALWTTIAVASVAIAAAVGNAAGALLPVGWAVTLATIAAVAVQPLRARLERLADRWVFGDRPDPVRVIAVLGASLAETYDLDELLPRMQLALRAGLDLEWARVRLTPVTGAAPVDAGPAAVLVAPIELGGERVGVIECGPRRAGRLGDAERELVETFARQAAMAVRNVRLKEELAGRAEELGRSRVRLVQAQERERRRIERDIHDGVQQELTALIGAVGHARWTYERSPAAVGGELDELAEGLRRVLGELRDFARGIHPSVLSDRGLLAAVEAIAARQPIPVRVRADPALRGQRLPEHVESAAYFVVAESIANALKHSAGTEVVVELRVVDGARLEACTRDDGAGFDPAVSPLGGLASLQDRLAAVGGALVIESAPGAGASVTAIVPLDALDGKEPA